MLQASVGQGAENRPDDVRLVQSLLNNRSPSSQPLQVDGVCGIATILAIRRFQAGTMGMAVPDGRIDPGGETLRALSQGAPAAATPAPCAPIPNDIVAAAQAAEQACGVPACISLAQWILESDRGAHMPPGSNNPFGIKAAAGEPYVVARTHEVRNGETITIDARFRQFPSVADAFAAHGRLLATGAPYQPAMQCTADPDLFADRLTGVYATDPNYGAALKQIMRGSNLYQFNLAAAPNVS
jgi:hypothetical protein